VPWLFVSTADHLEHHKRLTAHYAAPTFSVDRILACVVGQPSDWCAKFDAAEQVEVELDGAQHPKPQAGPPADAGPAPAEGEAYPVGAKTE
jgi:hypothetical protein